MKLTPIQQEVFNAIPKKGWWRPMDFGGRDGSAHSAILKALVNKGFVKKRRRGTLMNALGSARGSYEYSVMP